MTAILHIGTVFANTRASATFMHHFVKSVNKNKNKMLKTHYIDRPFSHATSQPKTLSDIAKSAM